jgi:hypothetical protein
MKLRGEVVNIEGMGDSAEITVTNVKRVAGASWQECGRNIHFRVPLSSAKSYPIGKVVSVQITGK